MYVIYEPLTLKHHAMQGMQGMQDWQYGVLTELELACRFTTPIAASGKCVALATYRDGTIHSWIIGDVVLSPEATSPTSCTTEALCLTH